MNRSIDSAKLVESLDFEGRGLIFHRDGASAEPQILANSWTAYFHHPNGRRRFKRRLHPWLGTWTSANATDAAMQVRVLRCVAQV